MALYKYFVKCSKYGQRRKREFCPGGYELSNMDMFEKQKKQVLFNRDALNSLLYKLITTGIHSLYQKANNNECWKLSPLYNGEVSDWRVTEVNCSQVKKEEYFLCENETYHQPNKTSVLGWFKCGEDDTYILEYYRCDGTPDCPNGHDEIFCEYSAGHHSDNNSLNSWFYSDLHTSCSFRTLQCPDGKCIPISKTCDGRSDCIQDHDERICNREANRKADSVNLSASNSCSPMIHFCIYNRDMSQDSNSCIILDKHLYYCYHHECPGMFKCYMSYCIPLKHVCDATVDCPQGDDEIACSKVKCSEMLFCKWDSVCAILPGM